jgi:hypothetical protein
MNYEKIYNDIISKARSEDRKKIKSGVYYEQHHIIPRCMGGDNDKSNLILLTAKEHYMAHRLLCLIYPEHKGLYYAIWNMSNGFSKSKKRYIPSARIFARLKEEYNKIPISDKQRLNMSISAKNKVPISEEHRKKISVANKGRIRGPLTDETKKKLADAARGKKQSIETILKRTKATKGQVRSDIVKKKMSDSWKHRPPRTEEHRKNISKALVGRKLSAEIRHRISESGKNRPPMSEEAKIARAAKSKATKLKNKDGQKNNAL